MSGTPDGDPGGEFSSSLIMPRNAFSHTFVKAGDYPYFSVLQPWQVGKIIVEWLIFSSFRAKQQNLVLQICSAHTVKSSNFHISNDGYSFTYLIERRPCHIFWLGSIPVICNVCCSKVSLSTRYYCSKLRIWSERANLAALFKIADLLKFNPIDACQITIIEQSGLRCHA